MTIPPTMILSSRQLQIKMNGYDPGIKSSILSLIIVHRTYDSLFGIDAIQFLHQV